MRWLTAWMIVVASALSGAAIAEGSLVAGDKLQLQVFDEPSLSGMLQVSASQTILVPLLGQVRVQGDNVPQLQQKIEALLADGYLENPQLTLRLQSRPPFYVLGEVAEPGRYAFERALTVEQAVATAGGYTHRANQKKFRLKRRQLGNTVEQSVAADAMLKPGDVLHVRQRWF